MGGDVESNGSVTEATVEEPTFTLEEARILNSLLDSAGFKGSHAKQVASGAQAKLEMMHPELLDND